MPGSNPAKLAIREPTGTEKLRRLRPAIAPTLPRYLSFAANGVDGRPLPPYSTIS